MATIIICDRCGEKIANGTEVNWWLVDSRKGLRNDIDDFKSHSLDLCEQCQESLEGWIKEFGDVES